jgi:hypothetical protein
MPTPAQHAVLARLAEALDRAAHGERGALVRAAATEMGVTTQTVSRWLADGHRPTMRKRRADAGAHAITREECETLARAMRGGVRANDKQIRTLTDAVDDCRANGTVRAERVDPETGEITPLSLSTIGRAMRAYGLDIGTLRAPAPHVRLASPHPNYLWQVDASVCVLFYLPAGRDAAGNAIVPLHKATHYKNRPENLRAIEAFRVIRYVATDHASGVIRVRYYPHAESGEHTVDFLCWLMADKCHPQDPFHGRPAHLMVDPGATASGLVRRFCARLGIDLIVNRPHNPRAKGQVEQANNLVEIKFEGWLACVADRVADFAALNALADTWQRWFNRDKKHHRHGMSRFDAWKHITREQLIVTGTADELRKFAAGRLLTPRVQGDLTVRFEGANWSVKHVPGIAIGKPLPICRLPLAGGGVAAVVEDDDGREIMHPLTEITTNGWGFPEAAATVGVEYKAPPETDAIKTGKRLDAMDAAARAASGAGDTRDAFGGAFNPYAAAERLAASNLTDLPMPGTPMTVASPDLQPARLSAARAALSAREALGERWRPEMYEWIVRRHPDGIDEPTLARLIASWQTGAASAMQ